MWEEIRKLQRGNGTYRLSIIFLCKIFYENIKDIYDCIFSRKHEIQAWAWNSRLSKTGNWIVIFDYSNILYCNVMANFKIIDRTTKDWNQS